MDKALSALNSLSQQIKKPLSGELRLRLASVSSVNSNQTINVLLAGSSTALPNVRCLDSCIPVVGQQIWILARGADMLAIGKIAVNGGAPTIASATIIAPTTPTFFVSGTTAIATITPPPFAQQGGTITIIPTGIFTTTTAGNIALASTAVMSKALIMVYDFVTLKWYPSY